MGRFASSRFPEGAQGRGERGTFNKKPQIRSVGKRGGKEQNLCWVLESFFSSHVKNHRVLARLCLFTQGWWGQGWWQFAGALGCPQGEVVVPRPWQCRAAPGKPGLGAAPSEDQTGAAGQGAGWCWGAWREPPARHQNLETQTRRGMWSAEPRGDRFQVFESLGGAEGTKQHCRVQEKPSWE